MILAVLIVNNFGRARLSKFFTRMVWHPCIPQTYTHHNHHCTRVWQAEQRKQQVVKQLFGLLTTRQENTSSFADADSWFGVPGARVVFRQYATLYFVMIVDGNESELSVLDLIQVMVETLDRHFKNVCELDVIFSSEQVHWVIDEMIVAGIVVETNMGEILSAVEAQSKLMREGDFASTALESVQSVLPR